MEVGRANLAKECIPIKATNRCTTERPSLTFQSVIRDIMGDFSRGFRRPDAGSHTIEGNVSGARAMQLEKQRQEQQEQFEAEKDKLLKKFSNSVLGIHGKFQTARIGTKQEEDFRAKTVGLVSAEAFLTAAQTMEECLDDEAKRKEQRSHEEEHARNAAKEERTNKRLKRKIKSLLSFVVDDGLEEEVVQKPSKVIKKDPTIDTSFLPDKQRQIDQEDKRKYLENEWKEKQDMIRKEPLEVVYSFWDGSGHRRTTKILKGYAVGDFLEKVRQDLLPEFKELANVSSDALMFVKEDLVSI
jgi:protein FAM50